MNIPSLASQAKELVNLNSNKNSVTIGTATQKIRFDLAGKAHGGIPTPHSQTYNKNMVDGVTKSVSRASKQAVEMTQAEIRMVCQFLEGRK